MNTSSAPDTSASMPLSDELRAHTAGAHERAEESRFVTELMAGETCRGAFGALVVQHLAIYRALEEVLYANYTDDPIVGPFIDPALDRVAALESDLAAITHLDQPDGMDELDLTPCRATQTYATMLRTEHTPEMMLANHYVRYLGDLSGGQAVARLVERHYDLGQNCLAFYTFDAISSPKTYKDAYRARLDQLSLTTTQRQRLLAEAARSFLCNQRVFADLDRARPGAHAAVGVTA